MKFVVGLGNLGEEYAKTRHNAGWLVIDTLATKIADFKFRTSSKHQSKYGKGLLAGEKVVLVKPQTFMNRSGESVKKILDYYKAPKKELDKDLYVVHDDLDFPLGKLRIHRGKSSGGHKGVQSVIDHIKTEDFVRFRIGVGSVEGDKKNYLLSNFNKREKKLVERTVERCVRAVIYTIKKGVEAGMNKYNS